MSRCNGTTKANKPCKRDACYDGYCLAHIPAPTEEELAIVQRVSNLCCELLKLTVNIHPMLLKGVSKEAYYEELVAFKAMTNMVGNQLASVRKIVDRLNVEHPLTKRVGRLTAKYAQALWFADDLGCGYNVLLNTV